MRGFFFSIVIFLLLGYILLSIGAWTTSVQIAEQRLAERFALKNAQTVLNQVGEDEVQRITSIIVYNSLYVLNSRAQQSAVREGPGDDEFFYIRQSMGQLVIAGLADADNFESGGALVLGTDSLEDWVEKLNGSLNEIGYRVTDYEIEEFSIDQSDPQSVEYTLVFSLQAESREGRTQIRKEYDIRDSIRLDGFIDPAAAREASLHGMEDAYALEKQFFFHDDYPSPSATRPIELPPGEGGQGWFYGKLVHADNADDVPLIDRPFYILVGTYEEITSLGGSTPYTDFGAYILTSSPGSESTACGSIETDTFNPIVFDGDCNPTILSALATEQPFMVDRDFNMDALDPKAPDGTPAVLFIAQYHLRGSGGILAEPGRKWAGVQVFNIENLRDFTLCGYYTQNDAAPSYLQRLLPESYERTSSLGIETMLVGGYIGGEGENAPVPAFFDDDLSRLDRELFNGQEGVRVRGMPGCKNTAACSGSSPIGHFRLGEDGRSDYLDNQIHCEDEDARASC